ncbi:hypothetical protein K458DRAFT_436233 [Lentithecium fluviatile CBS 122367]|uniref:Uncharacterized protein n=1 Tax=Lentithecium fluviatile CBS 122367 TaxID=1168545 RepID=A0A6G1IIB0_9PLEO|nr:hypothetical protein K458DRAFT_436233 [Lentithecium fluviatile CBS 122367]
MSVGFHSASSPTTPKLGRDASGDSTTTLVEAGAAAVQRCDVGESVKARSTRRFVGTTITGNGHTRRRATGGLLWDMGLGELHPLGPGLTRLRLDRELPGREAPAKRAGHDLHACIASVGGGLVTRRALSCLRIVNFGNRTPESCLTRGENTRASMAIRCSHSLPLSAASSAVSTPSLQPPDPGRHPRSSREQWTLQQPHSSTSSKLNLTVCISITPKRLEQRAGVNQSGM